jgi:glycogen operon protein
LQDLVSYEHKHNEANREDNKDGHNENFSANWGVEGETADAGIAALRDRVKRAMLATVFLSLGTPMLLAADELGRSQGGNNNAYCQDNETSWTDWTAAETPSSLALTGYVARLCALRKAHPTLRADHFLHGRDRIADGLRDIEWFDEQGTPMQPRHWQDAERRLLALRRIGRTESGTIEATLLILNASPEDQEYQVSNPELNWRLALDSSDPDRATGDPLGGRIPVPARSVILAVGQGSPA